MNFLMDISGKILSHRRAVSRRDVKANPRVSWPAKGFICNPLLAGSLVGSTSSRWL